MSDDVTYPSLFESFNQLVERTKIGLLERGGFDIAKEKIPGVPYQRDLEKFLDEAIQWPELVKCVRIFRTIYDSFLLHAISNRGIAHLIMDVANADAALSLQQTKTKSNYFELEKCFQESLGKPRVWAFIHQLLDVANLDYFQLNDKYRLRRATLAEDIYFTEAKLGLSLTRSRYIMETMPETKIPTFKEQMDSWHSEKHPSAISHSQEFYDLVTIIRLIRPCSVGIIDVGYDMPTEKTPYGFIHNASFMTMAYLVSPEVFPAIFGRSILQTEEDSVLLPLRCTFNIQQAQLMKNLWIRYRELDDSKGSVRLKRAYHLFNVAITSPWPENSISNLENSLENLFAGITTKNMSRYIDESILMLLKPGDDNPADLEKVVRNARYVRNKIIHGSTKRNIKTTAINTVKDFIIVTSKVLLLGLIFLKRKGGISQATIDLETDDKLVQIAGKFLSNFETISS